MNKLEIGQIIQIKPDFKVPCFRNCLATVTEPKDFGCLCTVQGVALKLKEQIGCYYLRLDWDDFIITQGFAHYMAVEEDKHG